MRSIMLAALLVLSAAACAPAPMADYDPGQRHVTTISKGEAVASVAKPLSATDQAVIRDLAAESLRRGAGPIQVDSADAELAAQVAGLLKEEGLAVQVRRSEDVTATIRVPVWVAKVPECGAWPKRINPDFRNQDTWNFGCSVERNIGLMVSNPADLERARESSGRDGNRAVDVLGKYGQGKATGSQAEAAAPSTGISTVGK